MLKKTDSYTENKDHADIKLKDLGEKLLELQQTAKKEELPVLIIIEGWDASGKGTLINELIRELDPRLYKVRVFHETNEAEKRMPFLWRFWTQIPKQGQMTIFDRSWYRKPMEESRDYKLLDSDVEDIKGTEKQLVDSGMLVIKLFSHITETTQKKRLDELESKESTKWRVRKKDRNQNKHYKDYYHLFDELLSRTNFEFSPWNIIKTENKKSASVEALKLVIEKIEEKLQQIQTLKGQEMDDVITENYQYPREILQNIDLARDIDDDEYKKRLKQLQKDSRDLAYELYRRKIPMILVFEGWDASGKGGAIKRLTRDMDPRGYEVIPIAAPDETQIQYHYLWRFWDHLPKTGHIAVFDRSWYGRVMVERLEGLASKDEWSRAYQEINDMEKHFKSYNAIVMKFFIHIDKDEQLERFNARQEDPKKNYKITEDDWRNRDKWDDYTIAVNEMLEKTDTYYAPWIVVEGNSKKYARIKVLESVTEMMKEAIKDDE